MITLYLDMDGVLCNFEEKFLPLKDPGLKYDKKIFRKAVMEYKIFEDLNYMPNALKLLAAVRMLPVNVEILTSVGTHDPMQGAEAARQKTLWLNKHGITYKPNFVRMFSEKPNYATPESILIDDRPDCAEPFTKAGGHGILHEDKYINRTIDQLNSLVLQIHAMKSL
jgi:hypothetical protein